MFTPPVPYHQTFDDRLFLFINHMPHTVVFDSIALTLSGLGTAGIIWFLLALWIFVREEHKDHWFFMPVIAAGITSWGLVELLLKPLIARSRPGDIIGAWRVINDPASFSFPSSHATIAFAMAGILSSYEPRWKVGWYSLAVAISLSRIYLGVHYPVDVIAGALLGVILGRMGLSVVPLLKKKKLHR